MKVVTEGLEFLGNRGPFRTELTANKSAKVYLWCRVGEGHVERDRMERERPERERELNEC